MKHSIYIYIYIYLSVTKAKLVSTSPLEVPREPFNVWFEFLDLETVTIGFFVKFWVGIVVLLLFQIKNYKINFGHVTFLGDHVMVPELRKCQIRIPREILGRNSGLTFVLAQK